MVRHGSADSVSRVRDVLHSGLLVQGHVRVAGIKLDTSQQKAETPFYSSQPRTPQSQPQTCLAVPCTPHSHTSYSHPQTGLAAPPTPQSRTPQSCYETVQP